jgi:hypothetical protein
MYGSFLCLDLAHVAGDDLVMHRTHARECINTLKHVQVVHRRSTTYNNKGPSTNTYMITWGTCYLTTMRFPKDMTLVP